MHISTPEKNKSECSLQFNENT